MSDAANRVLWTLIGVLLLAVGIAIGLMHFGRMPGVSSDSVLLSDDLLDLWHRGDDWNVAVLVAVGAVVTAFRSTVSSAVGSGSGESVVARRRRRGAVAYARQVGCVGARTGA